MKKNLEIILFTPEYPPHCGGVGYYTYYLAKALKTLGVRPVIIIRGEIDRVFNEDGIVVKEVRCPGVAPLNYTFIKRRLTTLINEMGGDLLHIHSSTMPWIETKLPMLVTAHSSAIESTKKFHRPIRDLHALYRNLMLPFYREVEGRLVRGCDLLTVVSNYMKREFYRYYQVDSEVVGNGVDLEKFNSGKGEKDYVLYVGMFTIGKGILDLVEAAPKIARQFPNAKIKMIGSGSLERYLLNKISSKGINNIQIIGHLPHSDVIRYYQESKVFVLPSYYEGLPTTILEAMACGLPVVATHVGGIPDQVEEGVNGYLIPPGRPDLLAERICRLLADPSLRDNMGRQGRLKVEDKFSWQLIASKFIGIYNRLINLSSES